MAFRYKNRELKYLVAAVQTVSIKCPCNSCYLKSNQKQKNKKKLKFYRDDMHRIMHFICNRRELTTCPCTSSEPILKKFLVDMSDTHTSKAPEPLPTARRIFLAGGMGTVRESTETGIESTDMIYVEIE